MGSSSSKKKKDIQETNNIPSKENNNLLDNNDDLNIKKELNKLEKKEVRQKTNQLPPIQEKKMQLKKNITNLESAGNIENIQNNNISNNYENNFKEEINNNEQIIINKVNLDNPENKNDENKEEMEKEIKVDKASDINNDVDEEIFKPIAKMELNRKSVMKKTRYRGITFVQNLKEFFPEDISKEEIRTMVINALSDSIVQNPKDFVPGKNLTKEQCDALSDIVYHRVKNNEDDDDDNNEENNENNKEKDKFKTEKYKILEEVKVKVGMSDLNKNIAKKLFFKDKENVEDEELERCIANLSQGNENVKVLIIEILE